MSSAAFASRPRQPPFEDRSRQGGVSNAMFRGKRLEGLQIVLVETHGDLFCARGANGDVEILEIFCELLDTVTRPERTLLLVSAETRDLCLPFCRGAHQRPPLLPRHRR